MTLDSANDNASLHRSLLRESVKDIIDQIIIDALKKVQNTVALDDVLKEQLDTAAVEDALEDAETVTAVVEDSFKCPDIAEFRKQIGWLEPDASLKKRRVSRCRRRLAAVWKPVKHALLRACCVPFGITAADELSH